MPGMTASYGVPLDFITFFSVFLYIIDKHTYLKCCIFTKFLQNVYLIDVHIFIFQHAKCDCRLWKVLLSNCVFGVYFFNSKHFCQM